MILVLLMFFLGILGPCDTLIPGSRLLDFPNPDFSKVVTFPDAKGNTYLEVKHGFGHVPFHVRVYAKSRDGSNADFVFEGTGACQNEGKPGTGPNGGIVFGYNENTITIWAPRVVRNRAGSMIYVGEGWGNGKYSQNSKVAQVTIEAWSIGPVPIYQTKVALDSKGLSSLEIPHPLEQLPEMISVRVSDANNRILGMHFHAVGATQTRPKSRMVGGVIFAHRVTGIKLWTPNFSKTGCIYIGKNWGKGKIVSSRNCFVNIRLWVNAFPPPSFQTDWTQVGGADSEETFIEIRHNLRLLPTLVKVQYRAKGVLNPLVFEGFGSAQSSQTGKSRYGGVLFAYDKVSVRLWLPSNAQNRTFVIFVGDGWGEDGDSIANRTAEVRVQIFADKCRDKTRVVDAQGYCRDISEMQLIQKMGPWGRCTNPCGNGTKTRKVQGCSGLSLQTVLSCDFSRDLCGFEQSGFNWTRSKPQVDCADGVAQKTCRESEDDEKQMSKNCKFLKEVQSKVSNFVYTQTKPCIQGERVNLQEGVLQTKDLGEAEGCVLTFKYTAASYFSKIQVDVLPTGESEWREEMWMIEDTKVQRGVWRSGYVNIGNTVPNIRKVRFVHKLPYSQHKFNRKCPGRCHPVYLTNITLRCERDDHHLVSEEKCEEKKLPLPSCIVNAFAPYSKGPAWSIKHDIKNIQDYSIGSFVMADGRQGDLIATYVFDIKMKDIYHLWFESFSVTNKSNDITIEINDKEKFDARMIYNEEQAIWLPVIDKLEIGAGKLHIKLYQKEKGFTFRNIMISPRNIRVWSALGMQSQLIPDNNLKTLTNANTVLGYSRLNGKGSWVPTDNSKGKMYFEIQFPEIALVNKIAMQGGKSDLGAGHHIIKAWIDSFKLKFSLHHEMLHESFAFYRENIKDYEYEFRANKDSQGIVELKLNFALVARAIRIYPENYTYPFCMRVEVYGFYMVKGMCPDLKTKLRKRNCTGDGMCQGNNQECFKDEFTRRSDCDCRKGYHGNKCNATGCQPNPCKNGDCVSSGTEFECDCSPGFYGRYCHLICPEGHYGRNCVHTCNCSLNETCNVASGMCTCKAGYEGHKCDQRCSNVTFGQNCSRACTCQPPLHCDHVTGDCYCPEGFYGQRCDVKCPNGTYGKNCTQGCNCFNNGTCKPDGKCDCPSGWFSDDCKFPCPQGRFGKMCSHLCHGQGNSTCDRVSGEITCAKGFTGRFCHESCPDGRHGEDCVHVCRCNAENTDYCRKDTGQCICKAGWRGESCDEKCKGMWGKGCKNKCRCQNSGVCDHTNGKCTCLKGYNGTMCQHKCFQGNYGSECSEEKGCVQGYYGFNCSRRCDCNLEKTDSCDAATGTCVCAPGHQGAHCTEPCDRHHWGMNCAKDCMCRNEGVCDSKDGSCYCAKGFEGEFCETKCVRGKYGKNCAQKCKCQNSAECDRVNGDCLCKPGFVGRYCENKCSVGTYGDMCQSLCQCVEGNSVHCSHINGSCTCKPGFEGEHCERECTDGFYGQDCRKTCRFCRHSNDACNKVNGSCSCVDGFTGLDCLDDCSMTQYGSKCAKKCECGHNQLCHNINGTCYEKSAFVFTIKLHFHRYTLEYFTRQQEILKENTALLIWHCLHGGLISGSCLAVSNFSLPVFGDPGRTRLILSNTYFVRIVNIVSRYSPSNDEVCVITMTLLNDTRPVNGSVVEDLLLQLPVDVLTRALHHQYYSGDTYLNKTPIPLIMTSMKWVVIGLSSFGAILTLFLICLICWCTKRTPYPPPFQKVRRDSKDFEMQPNMTCNSQHLLAFENPYYDVIAAMGLDEDIEEDYYNPLYDNIMDLHSDSETEPEDMYYFLRNNNYHHDAHYPCYDKDSGFSSGPLM